MTQSLSLETTRIDGVYYLSEWAARRDNRHQDKPTRNRHHEQSNRHRLRLDEIYDG